MLILSPVTDKCSERMCGPRNRTCKTPEYKAGHAAKNWAVKYQWIASFWFIDF